jgi:hypothetical protein
MGRWLLERLVSRVCEAVSKRPRNSSVDVGFRKELATEPVCDKRVFCIRVRVLVIGAQTYADSEGHDHSSKLLEYTLFTCSVEMTNVVALPSERYTSTVETTLHIILLKRFELLRCSQYLRALDQLDLPSFPPCQHACS